MEASDGVRVGREVRVYRFDRDLATERGLIRDVDRAEAASTKALLDGVLSEQRSSEQWIL